MTATSSFKNIWMADMVTKSSPLNYR